VHDTYNPCIIRICVYLAEEHLTLIFDGVLGWRSKICILKGSRTIVPCEELMTIYPTAITRDVKKLLRILRKIKTKVIRFCK